MKPLRITQHKDESPDLWAMRAYAMAAPYFSDDELRAMSGWIASHMAAELERRARQLKVAEDLKRTMVLIESKSAP